ncbi:MAG: hypothetical protein QNJ09_13515 [Paracoccaceae bacterium]|nr:hypothetical protein [Paracoccaceae bacterium]
MQDFDQSKIEYAGFIFDRRKVACYGMINNAGGTTTVLNFASSDLASSFCCAFLEDRNFGIVKNDAQVICLADYDTVMRKSNDDPRVKSLNYSRDFMMGTLAHVM